MRTQRKKEVDGIMQRWIMTIKDYSTNLMFLSGLPCKKTNYVVHKLEKYFGLVGYPQIFQTDNGKEYLAKVMVRLLKEAEQSSLLCCYWSAKNSP
jgi:hypothetical protein